VSLVGRTQPIATAGQRAHGVLGISPWMEAPTSVLNCSLSRPKSENTAAVLLHVFKGLSAVAAQKPAARRLLQPEIRHMVRVYPGLAQESANA
jgi:hypothetical protein